MYVYVYIYIYIYIYMWWWLRHGRLQRPLRARGRRGPVAPSATYFKDNAIIFKVVTFYESLIIYHHYLYHYSTGKILHTRNQHLRNHRGFSVASSDGFRWQFPTSCHFSEVFLAIAPVKHDPVGGHEGGVHDGHHVLDDQVLHECVYCLLVYLHDCYFCVSVAVSFALCFCV